MNLKKWLLPQLLSLNLHFSTACTFWITICKLKYQSFLDIYVRTWINCNDLQHCRHRFQNGWGRLWRISLRIALKFRRDRVWVWGFTSNSIRGVQMLGDAHTRWSCLHDAQGQLSGQRSEQYQDSMGFELQSANGQSFASKRVSLSTFWTRKPKFEVFRQTCSGQSEDNSETKRKR